MNPLEAYGKFQIYGGMITAGIVGLLMFIVGFIVLTWRDKVHTAKTKGVYSNVTCVMNTCSGNVQYKVNSNTFTIVNQDNNIASGSKVDVIYEPKNPSNGKVPNNGRFLGIPLILLGGIFVYGSVASWKAFSDASNNTKKAFSEVAGVSGLVRRV
jgi:hypothetical protein